ncbi:MAG: FmdB family zinc ribbon protein [Myxococcota bacterium]|nr:zinc ribbon domain-containing protein [Myxococcota bacterium]
MPIYEYECKKCHKMTEVMQRMSDPGPAKCPHCGSKRIERVMSQTSFQLKGDGWYITDYSRKDKEKKASKSKRDGDSGGETTKSETKSEAKADKSEKSESKKSKPSAKSD